MVEIAVYKILGANPRITFEPGLAPRLWHRIGTVTAPEGWRLVFGALVLSSPNSDWYTPAEAVEAAKAGRHGLAWREVGGG